MMYRIHLILTALFLLLLMQDASAQRSGERGEERIVRYGNLVYAEAASFPSDSAGTSRVDVFIRVAYDFLVFKKSGLRQPDSTFVAELEFAISIEDADGTIADNGSGTLPVYAGDYRATNTRDNYVLGMRTFYVRPGMHTVRLQLQDGNSTLERRVALPVKAVDFSSSDVRIGGIIPLQTVTGTAVDSMQVAGFSRSLGFATKTRVAIPASFASIAAWSFRVSRMEREDPDDPLTEGAVVAEATLEPLAIYQGVHPAGGSGIRSSFPLVADSGAAGAVHLFDLPFEHLDVGTYRIEISARNADGADSTRQITRVFWREMPWSLNDLEYSIFILRYILTEDEYDYMRDGSDQEKREKLKEFWRKRDRTPETEHNEVMLEYYRRVDEAFFKFRTLYIRDGADTDRGKIHILFGPPEDVRRLFEDDEMIQEIWQYPSLGKTFRFIDKNRDRNLILVQ